MNHLELYKLLQIPSEVIEQLTDYETNRSQDIPPRIYNKLFERSSWGEGIEALQKLLGDDENGIKILWEQLNIISCYSYDRYINLSISKEIFVDTMMFCTRFLKEYYRTFHIYRYVWAWWFPRQISLKEFRIGSLEYEFVDGTEREIAVHIPSDADLSTESVKSSLNLFYSFRRTYFAEWKNVTLTCDSWMLMPELEILLSEDSNVVAFGKLFQIDSIDRTATWYMGWIFPGSDEVNESLPERTTLQRELKKYLLNGNAFGIAKGHISVI